MLEKNAHDSAATALNRQRAGPWRALAAGAAGIALLELTVFTDVAGVLHGSALAGFGKYVRIYLTPIAWTFYLLALVGLLGIMDRASWYRRYKNRFWICFLWSIPCWCFFDWVNFYFMRSRVTGLYAWEYSGLPPGFIQYRVVGYLAAFGAVLPGIFLSAEVFMRLGLHRLRSSPVRIGRPIQLAVFVLGMLFFVAPFILRDAISNLMLWVSLIFLLDPINFWLRRPSIIGDWRAGRWGRTFSLMAGGLLCGLLWEFWNYWALAKWRYHLAFLGSWQQVRYFQMPVPGLLGFISFGVETWVMWQFGLLALSPLVEAANQGRAPGNAIYDYGCL